jgi:hypothetical protein
LILDFDVYGCIFFCITGRKLLIILLINLQFWANFQALRFGTGLYLVLPVLVWHYLFIGADAGRLFAAQPL